MWYSKTVNNLDYSKPIVTIKDNIESILLPQIKQTYRFIGYNWFSLDSGEYCSSCFFETAQAAVDNRLKNGYKVFNVKIRLEKEN